ncbi:hypothetical protein D3C71_1548530 [compost metagenome]
MLGQALGPGHAARQHDQVELLGQHVDQHGVAGEASTAGAGNHAPTFDAGDHHFDLGTAQHVDQGHTFDVFDAIGNGDKGT